MEPPQLNKEIQTICHSLLNNLIKANSALLINQASLPTQLLEECLSKLTVLINDMKQQNIALSKEKIKYMSGVGQALQLIPDLKQPLSKGLHIICHCSVFAQPVSLDVQIYFNYQHWVKTVGIGYPQVKRKFINYKLIESKFFKKNPIPELQYLSYHPCIPTEVLIALLKNNSSRTAILAFLQSQNKEIINSQTQYQAITKMSLKNVINGKRYWTAQLSNYALPIIQKLLSLQNFWIWKSVQLAKDLYRSFAVWFDAYSQAKNIQTRGVIINLYAIGLCDTPFLKLLISGLKQLYLVKSYFAELLPEDGFDKLTKSNHQLNDAKTILIKTDRLSPQLIDLLRANQFQGTSFPTQSQEQIKERNRLFLIISESKIPNGFLDEDQIRYHEVAIHEMTRWELEYDVQFMVWIFGILMNKISQKSKKKYLGSFIWSLILHNMLEMEHLPSYDQCDKMLASVTELQQGKQTKIFRVNMDC